jgi:hypothetical protein
VILAAIAERTRNLRLSTVVTLAGLHLHILGQATVTRPAARELWTPGGQFGKTRRWQSPQ